MQPTSIDEDEAVESYKIICADNPEVAYPIDQPAQYLNDFDLDPPSSDALKSSIKVGNRDSPRRGPSHTTVCRVTAISHSSLQA